MMLAVDFQFGDRTLVQIQDDSSNVLSQIELGLRGTMDMAGALRIFAELHSCVWQCAGVRDIGGGAPVYRIKDQTDPAKSISIRESRKPRFDVLVELQTEEGTTSVELDAEGVLALVESLEESTDDLYYFEYVRSSGHSYQRMPASAALQ